MTTRKVLVCGSRSWDNYAVMRFRLSNIDTRFTIVHGDDKGADRMAADIWTRLFKARSLAYPADWDKNGRRAGPIRNAEMLAKNPGSIDLVLAFSNDLSTSRGTLDMIKKAMKAKIPLEVIREDTYFHLE